MASSKQTVRLKGYREFLRASDRAGRESKKFARTAYREVGDLVRTDASARIRDGHPGRQLASDLETAAGFRTYVRARGISVEQSLRRTTGKHGEYGSWQMRHGLLPALESKEDEVMEATDDAIDRIADHFYGRV